MNRYEDDRSNAARTSFNKKKKFVVEQIKLFDYAVKLDKDYQNGMRRHKCNFKEYNLNKCVNYEVQGLELLGSKVTGDGNYGNRHFLERNSMYDVFEFPSYRNKHGKPGTGKFLVVMHNLTMNYWFITYEYVTCKSVKRRCTGSSISMFIDTYFCNYEGPLFGFSHYERQSNGQCRQYGFQSEEDAKKIGFATHDRFDLGERRERAYRRSVIYY